MTWTPSGRCERVTRAVPLAYAAALLSTSMLLRVHEPGAPDAWTLQSDDVCGPNPIGKRSERVVHRFAHR